MTKIANGNGTNGGKFIAWWLRVSVIIIGGLLSMVLFMGARSVGQVDEKITLNRHALDTQMTKCRGNVSVLHTMIDERVSETRYNREIGKMQIQVQDIHNYMIRKGMQSSE